MLVATTGDCRFTKLFGHVKPGIVLIPWNTVRFLSREDTAKVLEGKLDYRVAHQLNSLSQRSHHPQASRSRVTGTSSQNR